MTQNGAEPVVKITGNTCVNPTISSQNGCSVKKKEKKGLAGCGHAPTRPTLCELEHIFFSTPRTDIALGLQLDSSNFSFSAHFSRGPLTKESPRGFYFSYRCFLNILDSELGAFLSSSRLLQQTQPYNTCFKKFVFILFLINRIAVASLVA